MDIKYSIAAVRNLGRKMQGIVEDWRLIYRFGRQKANSMEGWICKVKDVDLIDSR